MSGEAAETVVVYGLWHLGCVTAACLASHRRTVGLDLDEDVVRGLAAGRAPLMEPGLDDLIGEGLASGRLAFTTSAEEALRDASVVWITFDTPVDERDEADVGFVRSRLEAIAPQVRPGTLVVVSSQLPVGSTRELTRGWADRGVRVACSPENLRLGKAIDAFRHPARVIVGLEDPGDRERIARLFAPFCERIEWMSLESAEMTKHALNAFLATSVAFINELARLCERTGADAREVERGLKSEPRIGPGAYLGPGPAFAGGTLARDLRFLAGLAD
ncbi:MAG TPA: nucleotide sugar dehydrogenase, partial [Vicinamibacteria bacterium]|nr:nucleotide sugar dehydrogenase [Vicinamibacteria bacterium]